MIDERKMSKQPLPAPTASAVGPCPTIIQISKTPRYGKFIKPHRTTRPPPKNEYTSIFIQHCYKGNFCDFLLAIMYDVGQLNKEIIFFYAIQ